MNPEKLIAHTEQGEQPQVSQEAPVLPDQNPEQPQESFSVKEQRLGRQIGDGCKAYDALNQVKAEKTGIPAETIASLKNLLRKAIQVIGTTAVIMGGMAGKDALMNAAQASEGPDTTITAGQQSGDEAAKAVLNRTMNKLRAGMKADAEKRAKMAQANHELATVLIGEAEMFEKAQEKTEKFLAVLSDLHTERYHEDLNDEFKISMRDLHQALHDVKYAQENYRSFVVASIEGRLEMNLSFTASDGLESRTMTYHSSRLSSEHEPTIAQRDFWLKGQDYLLNKNATLHWKIPYNEEGKPDIKSITFASVALPGAWSWVEQTDVGVARPFVKELELRGHVKEAKALNDRIVELIK